MSLKISILMGIYNCASTLPDAIESILAQTYTNWELIMCDDGSSDDTYSVAEAYQIRYPDRILLLKNNRNMGLNYTLNRCLSVASGALIARMDGDDHCSPERLEREASALQENPQMAIVSTAMTYFDESGTWGKSNVISEPQPIDFLYGTPFCHAPAMMCAEAVRAVGGYTEEKRYLRVEDYDLWVKLYVAGYRGMNLSEPLYHMRDDRNAFSRRKYRYRINEARVICKAVRLLKLPKRGYIRALRPLLVGLLPGPVYRLLHKKRLRSVEP